MKPETRFRINKIDPFLKKLKNTTSFSIQQRAISGTPDYLICANGLFVAMEVKTDTGKFAELQKHILRGVHRTNGLSMAVSPSNWEAAKDLLTTLDKGMPYDKNEIFGDHEWSITTNSSQNRKRTNQLSRDV